MKKEKNNTWLYIALAGVAIYVYYQMSNSAAAATSTPLALTTTTAPPVLPSTAIATTTTETLTPLQPINANQQTNNVLTLADLQQVDIIPS